MNPDIVGVKKCERLLIDFNYYPQFTCSISVHGARLVEVELPFKKTRELVKT
jgi:hypothetical protein